MNTKGGLYLRLADDNSPAWEEECNGTFIVPDVMHSLPGSDSKGFWTGCNAKLSKPALVPCVCHGTGRIGRRLVGAVVVEYGADTIGLWFDRNPIILQPTDYDMSEFVGEIIAAHRSGELRKQAPDLYADPGDPADGRLREVGA